MDGLLQSRGFYISLYSVFVLSSPDQREERQRYIKVHMHLLQHASSCEEKNCQSKNCSRMKVSIAAWLVNLVNISVINYEKWFGEGVVPFFGFMGGFIVYFFLFINIKRPCSPLLSLPNFTFFLWFDRFFWYQNLLMHGSKCPIRAQGGCSVCKRVWALLQIHARQCKNDRWVSCGLSRYKAFCRSLFLKLFVFYCK